MTASARRNRLRRVAVVTGTRAEYGLLRSTLEAIESHRALRLQLVVTGSHLLKKFGHTIHDILRDGWRVDARVKMQTGDDGAIDQALGLARGVAGMATYFDQAKTDIVVVLGDRIEAMAGALAAVTTGRLLAHIHGGDIAPGDFDDSLRHAITKLSHLHLTATEAASRRIIRMGESPERVHCVGAPGLDRLVELVRESARRRCVPPVGDNGHPSLALGARNGALRDRSRPAAIGAKGRLALIVQHPCGRAASHERRVMNAVLTAVHRANLSAICVFPNSDRGHSGILEAIEVYRRRATNGSFQVVRSLDRDCYLRLLIQADVLVGNSSSGIIEAATAGTPAVNVGPRQEGRDSNGTVIHVGESEEAIGRAIAQALRTRPIMGAPTLYGDGSAGRRIAELLATMPLDDAFRRKTLTV